MVREREAERGVGVSPRKINHINHPAKFIMSRVPQSRIKKYDGGIIKLSSKQPVPFLSYRVLVLKRFSFPDTLKKYLLLFLRFPEKRD